MHKTNIKDILKLLNICIFSIIIFFPLIEEYFSAKWLIFQIVCLFFFVIIQLKLVNFDLFHPFTFFLLIFYVYTVATPILSIIGVFNIDYLILSKVIIFHYIAMICFMLPIPLKRFKPRFDIPDYIRYNNVGIRISFFLSVIICFIYIVFLYKSGFHSKYERALSEKPFAFLGFGFYMLTTVISIIITKNSLLETNNFKKRFKKSWNYRTIFFWLTVFFIAFLITGERHTLFKFFIVIGILIHVFYKPVKSYYLFPVFVLGILFSTVLNQFKMSLLTGTFHFDMNEFLNSLFYSEFKSSSRNLSILIENVPVMYPYFYGKSFVLDLFRGIIPGFIFPRHESTAIWFNKTFFTKFFQSGGGVGFSLVGEGYVNFGIPGIILLFTFLGLFVRWLYLNSKKNMSFFIIYINFLSILCFSIRGDISPLISQTIKHVLFVLIILKVTFILGKGLKR